MKTINYAVLFLILLVSASGHAAADGTRMKVVTTLNYLRAITAEIGGEHVDAVALANPRQDPHYVTPTPAMNQLASDARLFIESGLSLDLWAKNIIDASGNPAIQPGNPGHCVATINVPVLELPTEVSRSWGDIHPQGNPHVWLDPLNVIIIANNIADRLKQIDPANEADYQSGFTKFRDKIESMMFGEELLKSIGKSGGDILIRKARNGTLLEWLKTKKLDTKLGGWMKTASGMAGTKIISYHKTYVYFGDRFGLQMTGELEEKPGIPPPPQHRDEIIAQMKRDGIRIILNDNFYSREAADYVAEKTGSHVIVTYVDVGATPETDTYEKMISTLLEEIQQAQH